MYIFEASYINLDTRRKTIRSIEFNGDALFDDEKECYLYAMGKAYDLMDKIKETFSTLEFISC